MGIGSYMAMKDAERSDGSVNWDEVPLRHGGNLNTGHPEDREFHEDHSRTPRFDLRTPKD